MTMIQFHSIERLDFVNVSKVFTKTKDWIRQHPQDDVVIDFSLVQFIDSAGVAMLVELRKLAKFNNKSLTLNISPAIHRMLAFYELENFLDVSS